MAVERPGFLCAAVGRSIFVINVSKGLGSGSSCGQVCASYKRWLLARRPGAFGVAQRRQKRPRLVPWRRPQKNGGRSGPLGCPLGWYAPKGPAAPIIKRKKAGAQYVTKNLQSQSRKFGKNAEGKGLALLRALC